MFENPNKESISNISTSKNGTMSNHVTCLHPNLIEVVNVTRLVDTIGYGHCQLSLRKPKCDASGGILGGLGGDVLKDMALALVGRKSYSFHAQAKAMKEIQ